MAKTTTRKRPIHEQGEKVIQMTVLDELEQGVVEEDHASSLSHLHERGYLEGLAFPHEVADCRVDKKNLVSRNAPASDFLAESLGDNTLERLGKHCPDLFLPVGGELVDHAIDR